MATFMVKDSLKDLGLDAEEAAMYVAALELGPSGLLGIARKTKQNRTTLYAVADRLREKGLLSETVKGKRKLYIAEPPEKLKVLLKEKLAKLDDVLPELLSLVAKGGAKAKIRYDEGIEGIKNAFLGSVGSKEKNLYAFVGFDRLTIKSKVLLNFWQGEFLKKRLKNNVVGNLVLPDTEAAKNYRSQDKQQLRQSRLVPASTYNFEGEILTYDNVVCFLSYSEKEEFALTLESESIARTVKMIWRIVWNAGY